MVKVTISAEGIGERLLGRIPAAVQRVSQAVIASCEPFVPYDTGELCRSVSAVGNGGGMGLVVYSAPHAALCYYAERKFKQTHHPQACAHWFEAAKAVDLAKWTETAASALSDTAQNRKLMNDGK